MQQVIIWKKFTFIFYLCNIERDRTKANFFSFHVQRKKMLTTCKKIFSTLPITIRNRINYGLNSSSRIDKKARHWCGCRLERPIFKDENTAQTDENRRKAGNGERHGLEFLGSRANTTALGNRAHRLQHTHAIYRKDKQPAPPLDRLYLTVMSAAGCRRPITLTFSPLARENFSCPFRQVLI